MPKNLALSAFSICLLSTYVNAAELKPTDIYFGTASADITVVLPQVWRLSNYIRDEVRLDRNGEINTDAILARFRVKNLTSSPGKYYISANGRSRDYDGKFVAYPEVTGGGLSSFSVKPVADEDDSELVFDSVTKRYAISRELTAQSFDNIIFKIDSVGKVINPGMYSISLELFAPAV